MPLSLADFWKKCEPLTSRDDQGISNDSHNTAIVQTNVHRSNMIAGRPGALNLTNGKQFVLKAIEEIAQGKELTVNELVKAMHIGKTSEEIGKKENITS